MANTALIRVLGAVAYGEWKAHEGARQAAAEAPSAEERAAWEQVAAEELRHYEGFVERLRALGADPDRAMRPYREALDTYHGHGPGTPVQEAVWSYLGEGIADDLLQWLRKVVDEETAAFVDTVIADEEGHEARATEELRALLDRDPGARAEARAAVRTMLRHMLGSGRASGFVPFGAFLRLGRPHELVGGIAAGMVRRLRAVGLDPFAVPSLLELLRLPRRQAA